MKFPFGRKHQKPVSHKRMLLTDPNSLIGYRIDGGRIKLMSVIGVGGNGVVYHAVECCPADTQPPRQFAIKALSKVGLEPQQLRSLEREFELHTRVSAHPHVVTLHGIVDETDFVFVVLDYLPEGDLFDMMDVRRAYVGNDALIRSVFLQLLDAVEHCHALGVAHRDIKPENILCRDGGRHVLLADFGLSTDRQVVQEYGLGSEPYMAPQCFGGIWEKLGPYSAAQADVWALGVVLVNLACARNPWHKASAESAIFTTFLNEPDHLLEILPISRALNDVLKRTFALNPHARISLRELRARVRAIGAFTLTGEALRRAGPGPDVRDAVAGARQITNLTAADVARLAREARAEAREAALLQERRRAARAQAVPDEDDEAQPPLFLSPVFPPPAGGLHACVSCDGAGSAGADSDEDEEGESDAESAGPVTPASGPAADVDIAAVPEIRLDGDCGAGAGACVVVGARGACVAAAKDARAVPETRRGPRRVWRL